MATDPGNNIPQDSYSTPLSPEALAQARSARMKTRWADPAWREKMLAVHQGKMLSAEHKEKIGAGNKGKTYRAKVVAAPAQVKGRPIVDAATRARLFALRGGRVFSPESQGGARP